MRKLEVNLIREEISRLFPNGNTTLSAVAQAFNVSPRTLQRQLAEEGITFHSLLDEVRFVHALRLISTHHKISDIAFKLGYADASSFTRVFKRWTGLTPQTYRKRFSKITSVSNHMANNQLKISD